MNCSKEGKNGSFQTEIDMHTIEEEMLLLSEEMVELSSIATKSTKEKYSAAECIQKLRENSNLSMCRIPGDLCANYGDESYYEPKFISIGPYHLKNEKLGPSQKLKLQYLSDLLGRSEENNLGTYMEAIREVYLYEKDKYFEFNTSEISDDEFLKMLVLDGCFLVELLLKHNDGWLMFPGIDIHELNHDLMLIENQVPFSVLKLIYENTKWGSQNHKIKLFDLAVRYLHNGMERIGNHKEVESIDHLLHLLYICRSDRLEIFPTLGTQVLSYFQQVLLYLKEFHTLSLLIYCFIVIFLETYYDHSDADWRIFIYIAVTILLVVWLTIYIWGSYVFVGLVYLVIWIVEHMFKFNKKSTAKDVGMISPLVHGLVAIPTITEITHAGIRWSDISYTVPYKMTFKSKIMQAGSMEINDNSFSEFENLLLYEQIYFIPRFQGNETDDQFFYMSSYTLYLRNLVKTNDDVNLLQKHGVLNILPGSIEIDEIRNFFGKKRPWLVLNESHQKKISYRFKSLQKFVRKGHCKRRTKLTKDYFVNPIIIFSFAGFVMITVLTYISTIYTIMSYFKT
ncbi:hypothetical protein ZOSMA_390G00050 [Zostera marina]|uniref:Uncharacterized protein n=1 Tax=Zostera marina TaxID=29655 RepID=A0A0K9P4C2_ZOSMR|nr:hypothetical protein ZOSMA_390G00050 [Zostera marina]